MKKLLAFLLVLALLLPMGIAAQADETAEKPFYLVQWGSTLEEQTNVYSMAYLWSNSGKLNNVLSSVWYGAADSYEIPNIAAALKEKFDTYPEGARYFMLCLIPDAFKDKAENIIFVDEGVALVQQWLDAFLAEYKRIGGKLDGIVVDIEFEDLYATYIQSRYAVKDPMCYQGIVENPLYATDIRPELEARGFKFYEKVTAETPEIYSIHPKSGTEYASSRSIWDAVLRSYINGKVTEACEPLWKYYPDAEMSDYQSKDLMPWLKELNDFGALNASGGNYYTAGTSSNENYYSVRPYNFFTDSNGAVQYRTLPGYNKAIYADRTFNYFLYEANVFKNTYLGSRNGEVSFWIAHYMYNLVNENSPSLTPYYAEQILHMGLLNPQAFMGYIIESEVGYEEDYYFCLDIVDDVLKELTRMVGSADRTPIDVEVSWNSSFVLSGMNVGDKNIYRITPDTALVSLEDFKVEGDALTFYINGETITFPGGKIVEDGQVRGWDANQNVIYDGTCGYWVETAADVKPIVTREADHHRNNPAYGEDYESYEIGTEYTYKSALPVYCWEAKKVGSGTATVIADPSNPDNKVLALTGGYSLKNVNLPQNVTAGDSYAENQAWEVEVTIPSDMAADAELVLLSASGNKKKAVDGGFKVVGNQVYYSQGEEYVELSGVTLTAGNKYRFVRDMDFNDADAFTCDYYVYDASGALLGSAKDVALAAIEISVQGVEMSCTGVSGEAVLLDNFKLYPTKVGYDFELYDENTGIQVTNLDTPRAANTAYRFSWLNATNKEKTYSVMAAYYEGDKLVEEKVFKEVKLAANFEGLDYGVVEVPEGQTVKVYLRNDNPADDDDTTGVTKKDSGVDPILFVLIGVVAVVVIAVVVALLLTGKKAPKGKKTVKKVAKKAEPKKDAE